MLHRRRRHNLGKTIGFCPSGRGAPPSGSSWQFRGGKLFKLQRRLLPAGRSPLGRSRWAHGSHQRRLDAISATRESRRAVICCSKSSSPSGQARPGTRVLGWRYIFEELGAGCAMMTRNFRVRRVVKKNQQTHSPASRSQPACDRRGHCSNHPTDVQKTLYLF